MRSFIDDNCADVDCFQLRSVTEIHAHVSTYLYNNPVGRTAQRKEITTIPMTHLLNPRAGRRNMNL
jgi:hypothetical protein